MKRIGILLLAVLVLLSVTACDFALGSDEKSTPTTSSGIQTEPNTHESGEGTSDASDTDAPADTLYPEDGPDWSNNY